MEFVNLSDTDSNESSVSMPTLKRFKGYVESLKKHQPVRKADLPKIYSSWLSGTTLINGDLAARTVEDEIGHLRMHIKFLAKEGIEAYMYVYGMQRKHADAHVSQEITEKIQRLNVLISFPQTTLLSQVRGLKD